MNNFTRFFFHVSDPSGAAWRFYALLGTFFILFGLLIVAMPELLALIVASFLIFIGVSIFIFSLTLRSATRKGPQVIVEPRDLDW